LELSLLNLVDQPLRRFLSPEAVLKVPPYLGKPSLLVTLEEISNCIECEVAHVLSEHVRSEPVHSILFVKVSTGHLMAAPRQILYRLPTRTRAEHVSQNGVEQLLALGGGVTTKMRHRGESSCGNRETTQSGLANQLILGGIGNESALQA
jgi:hypothetical protein